MCYDLEIFLQPVSQELICPINQGVLENSVCGPCDHVFCDGCVRPWIVRHGRCPVCRASFGPEKLRAAPPIVRGLLAELSVRCRNFTDGCTERLSLGTRDRHAESACKFETCLCPHKCDVGRIPRRFLDAHVENCSMAPMLCAKGCGLSMTRFSARNHDCVDALRAHAATLEAQLRASQQESENLRRQVETLTRRMAEGGHGGGGGGGGGHGHGHSHGHSHGQHGHSHGPSPQSPQSPQSSQSSQSPRSQTSQGQGGNGTARGQGGGNTARRQQSSASDANGEYGIFGEFMGMFQR